MSEPRLIAPLLSNHIIGEVISDHCGVRCYPVMEKDSENKYIVKIISVPASQTQLDALKLMGICTDDASLQQYFSQQTESTVQEAALLKHLSTLEGFVCYDDWQVEPMEDAIGYEIYLMSSYRATLARHFARQPMTHLDAMNLGLDLCSALSVCRQEGYLYVALKPSNIYITESNQYRIGDLGFIHLDSLSFTSLPEKYHSEYTPPEVSDAYSTLNTTMDTYAVGLILYQAYNNGEFPHIGENGTIAPPAYADYEMAEIILKACALDPAQRWQTPIELGQALIAYMQRNGISNTPIVPAPVAEPINDEQNLQEETQEAPISESEEESKAQITDIITLLDDYLDDPSPVSDTDDEDPELDQLAFSLNDETVPEVEIVEGLEATPVSAEVSQMLAQADDLIQHETPEPVQQPDPVFVSIADVPEPSTDSEEVNTDDAATLDSQDVNTADDEAAPAKIVFTEEEELQAEPAKPKKRSALIITLSVILILLVLSAGCLVFYELYYIQTIDNMTLNGAEDYLTVSLTTDTDSSLLTVVCTDTYGNTKRAQVVDGKAHFTELAPDTHYKVSVEISGFHKLNGTTTDRYTTVSRTDVISFTAVTGSEDGSVILSFAVTGNEETAWRISYRADGEDEKTQEFTGHVLNLNGLTIGKEYTFSLTPVSDIYVVGECTVVHTASKLVFPENVTIHGFRDGVLHAGWDVPADVTVNSWTVRCYNDSGYDRSFTVDEPKISIADLDTNSAYTIDVTATGMSLGMRAHVSAGSITVKDVTLDDSEAGKLSISWDYEGTATEGWMLLYTVDGSEQQVIRCETREAIIPSLIPGGEYSYTIQALSGATVFSGTGTYTAPGGEDFNRFNVTADSIHFRMCRTQWAGWNWYEMWESVYTTEFAINERASFVVSVDGNPTHPKEEISILFVIKDSAKNPVSIATRDRNWSDLCDNKNHGEIDIPIMPTVAGNFTMDIYFDNAYVGTQEFTVK